MIKNISLSTSLSYKHNWDPIYSIEITKKLDLDYIQIFLGDNFFIDDQLGKNINHSYTNSLNFLLHAPTYLNRKALNPDLLHVVKSIKPQKSLVVFHHDYTAPIKDILDIVKTLNNHGITPLLENFYPLKCDILKCIEHYKEIILLFKRERLQLYPLLDIPRLFISWISSKIDPMYKTKELLTYIKFLNLPLYLHLIDTSDSDQNRSSWTSLGSGIIPYNELFDFIEELGLDIQIAVLEYEEEDHLNNSINYLNSL
ncbi:hypothetical protein EW093_00055 [Thiospirochaeta perfilievii]|uniref:Sugar phosphate isomerase/epimerase n=1 Tax=Thiospirochaeta perfilievii TaxID=252967 RepID=A0A5C1Q816_9SPIO|nr:hypothetical protein [Thiospirochaeta perfilievii]QEN03159.1 hypothetical protein EW093_00055 [Thiospirochaeta perfilievii]